MDIFNDFATDEVKEESGVTVPFGDGSTVTVARTGNTVYTKLMISTYEVNEHKVKDNPELDDLLNCQILAKTILKGWEGFTFKGKPFPYSIENATKALAIKDFRKKILVIANKFENFKVELDKADVKN